MEGSAMNVSGNHGIATASSVLDRVTWTALGGPQAHLAQLDEDGRRYAPEVAPFAAVRDEDATLVAAMVSRTAAADSLAFATLAPLSEVDGAVAVMRAMLLQMVLVDAAALGGPTQVDIGKLSGNDVPEMLCLAQATRPGPFGPRTIEMGTYLGIRVDGALAAMAGERQRVPGFSEISAVCVDPACRGRGYAGALVARLARDILDRGAVPFLHVVKENVNAIALYRRLGFVTRRELHLAIFKNGSRDQA